MTEGGPLTVMESLPSSLPSISSNYLTLSEAEGRNMRDHGGLTGRILRKKCSPQHTH